MLQLPKKVGFVCLSVWPVASGVKMSTVAYQDLEIPELDAESVASTYANHESLNKSPPVTKNVKLTTDQLMVLHALPEVYGASTFYDWEASVKVWRTHCRMLNAAPSVLLIATEFWCSASFSKHLSADVFHIFLFEDINGEFVLRASLRYCVCCAVAGSVPAGWQGCCCLDCVECCG